MTVPNSSYTEAGDPSIDATIEHTLARVVAAAAGTDGLETILLGGSLARGEGTPEGGTISSDAEIYLVGPSADLRRTAAALERDLNAPGARPTLSIAWMNPERLRRGWAKNLSRRPSRTIHLYELSVSSRALHGPLPSFLEIDPVTIPLAEGVRLILNRLAESAPLLAGREPAAGRWLGKVLIACGDTILLGAGAYTSRYRERATRLAKLSPPWAMPGGWRPPILAAFERKLTGVGPVPTLDGVAHLVDATLREAVHRSPGFAFDGWDEFPGRFATAAAREPAFLRYLPPAGPPALYEGLILLLRVRRGGLPLSPRALLAVVRGGPLSLWMQGAAAPLFFGIATASPELVSAASAAMGEAGVPRRRLGAAGGAAPIALTLKRYWEMSA